MVPGLSVLPVGEATDHVIGLTDAENCTCVPMVAEEPDGVTVMVGDA